MKGRLSSIFAVMIVIGILFIATYYSLPQPDGLKTFSSEEELRSFLQTAGTSYFGVTTDVLQAPAAAEVGAGDQKAHDYSTTTIQVHGVDEADMVKNDGQYIYTLSGNTLNIINAFPADHAALIATINITEGSAHEFFITDNRLVLFSTEYQFFIQNGIAEALIAPYPGPLYPTTFVHLYDITDRSQPHLLRTIPFNGTYYDSRLIDDQVYMITTTPSVSDDQPIPLFTPNQTAFPEIHYIDYPDYSYQFTTLVSLDTSTGHITDSDIYLFGYSSTLYVSQENLYLVLQKQSTAYDIFKTILDKAVLPVAPPSVASSLQAVFATDTSVVHQTRALQQILVKWMETLSPEEQKALVDTMDEQARLLRNKHQVRSEIHKIALQNRQIEYKAKGDVVGTPLNQFSMDEYNGYFRIATTRGGFSGNTTNNLYVLDDALNTIGTLEDLAPGERIFSARFMGEKAYLVTFVQTDPLFVIDLSNPTAPRVLGELKIPGVSDYLHPYDENHIIGIGRGAESLGGRVMFTGLKISLFDVTDVTNPIEKTSLEIGDRGTYSEALHNHKAILFDKERNLLVLPIDLYEQTPDQSYGSFKQRGAAVFTLNLNELNLRGWVIHNDQEVRRSLFMDNTLYTLSDQLLQAHTLDTLDMITEITLPTTYSVISIPEPVGPIALR